MSTQLNPAFEPVRYEDGRSFTIAGFGQTYTPQTNKGIPALWERFAREVGSVPGQVDDYTYGLCCNFDGNGGFLYIAGVEVVNPRLLPETYVYKALEPQRYAVFEHHGRLATLGHTFEKIWKQWMPNSGETPADAPEFERYAKDFDPNAAHSVLEIWIPLKRDR